MLCRTYKLPPPLVLSLDIRFSKYSSAGTMQPSLPCLPCRWE